ncbi:MAG: phospholipid carrier-dependent glycosyltransferase [Solirubrobacteraceae bacterium]|nr:phospholipid carrier-dependent glycosyltransferase [Solirubrobacteraceae bacterium]
MAPAPHPAEIECPIRAVSPSSLLIPVRRVAAIIARHRGFAILLALGTLVHALAYYAFFPALFFPDSWTYLSLAWNPEQSFVGFDFSRPSGYPMFLWALQPLAGHHVSRIALVQQVLAVGAGALVYVVLEWFSVRRWISLSATALVLFDAYLLTLAQTMLGDTLVMALVIAAVAIVALLPADQRWGGAGAIALAALAGLLLGYGVTVRTVTMFVIPVLLVYALWARKGWIVAAALTIGFVAPVLSYLQWHKNETGAYSFTEADGWFLYARIGEIGQCRDAKIPASAQAICPQIENPPPHAFTHLWGWTESPAVRAFGVGPQDRKPEVNAALKDFAVAIIKDRPLRYAQMVGADVLRYFRPGVHGESGSDVVLMGEHHPSPSDPARVPILQVWAPRYNHAGGPRLPDGIVDAYAQTLHTPRWLLGIGTLLAGLATAAAIVLRRRFELEHRREAFLLLGSGLALVVGATATSEFVLRYLMPALPLLWAGIALVLADVLALRRRRRAVTAP